ncbi:uncharacterized protein LOC135701958 [Ochlerotatus camptorhynchus]|uniref:uncharacterized protein LOC135701958 n=1 Tax=Ochlerotatus camptorhynchus TaxID=644619 RepID=UPI0031E31F02
MAPQVIQCDHSTWLHPYESITSFADIHHLEDLKRRQIAVVGDVREMFFQLLIRAWDRQSQCFVWHDNPSLPVEVYVIDVATFGSTCSPCSAQYVKNRNAEEYRTEFPEAVEAIINNHYVDDYLDSRDTEEEAIRIASDVKQVHAKAGFELRNWLSNSEEVVRRVGESSASECKSFATDKSTGIERVLGMRWQPIKDEFTFKLCLREDVAQLLDGDTIPTNRWRQWVQAIKRLDRETVPRCYFPGYSSAGLDNIELHVFVDASLVAFSCVAYFRIIDQGQVRCALVAAKSKVAPLKPLSIPRLELQAAVLGSRLMKSVQESHTLPIRRRMIWSDSSTVLSWIQSDQRRYRQSVAVRVGEILSETSVDEWRKVPGKLNVADEATKWGEGPCFKNGSRWFTGPEFLYKAELEWPGNELPEPNIPEDLRVIHAHHREITEPLIDYRRFSKWERLQRVTAYMLRFCANCSGKVRGEKIEAGEVLSQEELQFAEETLFRWIQTETYPDEMIAAEEQHQRFPDQAPRLERTSPLCKLSPMLDETGMLRMDGRIGATHYATYAARFPVILPKNHYVTDLILNWYHRQYGHGNSETVVNEVRQRFHVSSLRNAVRKVAKTCKWCVVRKATPQPPRMASLPECRLAAYIRPFTFVGMDYCGPFFIRIGRASAKRWVALFVCQTVRAIHLEVVNSLSTESCKMAVRRFIARRGAPQEIYSDQGTNFQGASNDLKREIAQINSSLANTFTNRNTSWRFNPLSSVRQDHRETVIKECAEKGIQWHFNPPSAPHFGGLWETAVRSAKTHSFKVVGETPLSTEDLTTLRVQIEGCLNSRPLTPISDDPTDFEPLTPGHF